MSASTRRLLLAIVAWPAGIIATLVWSLISAEPAACEPGVATCTVALKVVPLSEVLESFALAIAPGLFATIYWWRNRGEPS